MPKGGPPLTPEQLNDPQKIEQVRQEGTVQFWVNDSRKNWATDSDTYVFPPISKGGITIKYKKLPNRTFDLSISGPFAKEYSFNAPIPKIEAPKGLMVSVVWKRPSVILYLNGKVAQTFKA